VLGLEIDCEVLCGLTAEHLQPALRMAAVDSTVEDQQRLSPFELVASLRGPVITLVQELRALECQIRDVLVRVPPLGDTVLGLAAGSCGSAL